MIGSSGPCPTSLAPKGPRGSGSSMSSVSTSGMSSEVGLLYSSMEGNLCTSAWESRFGSQGRDRKSTRLNSSHGYISYAVFCLKKKKNNSYKVCEAPADHTADQLHTLDAPRLAHVSCSSINAKHKPSSLQIRQRTNPHDGSPAL